MATARRTTTSEDLRERARTVRTRLAGGTLPTPAAGGAMQSVPGFGDIVQELWYGGVWARPELDVPYRCLATVSALTALVRPAQLRGHTANALRSGITPAQVLEVMVHVSFYAGVPAALGGIEVAREVFKQRPEWEAAAPKELAAPRPASLEERRQKAAEMRRKVWGAQPTGSVPAAQELAPEFLDVVYAYLFGEVYYRPGLDLKQRAVCTLSTLTVLGREAQLRVHIRGALNVGLSKQEVVEALAHTAAYGGLPAALNALGVAKAVFDQG